MLIFVGLFLYKIFTVEPKINKRFAPFGDKYICKIVVGDFLYVLYEYFFTKKPLCVSFALSCQVVD